LRKIENNKVGEIDARGFSVSGEIRSAALLSEAGFHAYDGRGCIYNPVLSGIKSDKSPLYATRVDESGAACGQVGKKYITGSYKVPASQLPDDAVIVAANGGSDYFYVPSHNKKIVERLTQFFANHTQFDAIFIDDGRYGKLPGTLPMSLIGIQNPQGRSPDIIVGFSYDETVNVNGLPGIEFSDGVNARGMHGSFSPIDIHNFMMGYGPDFRAGFKDSLPSGNVDVAPTVAHILGLDFPESDGRILTEALIEESPLPYKIESIIFRSEDALNVKTPQSTFLTKIHAKLLTQGNKQFYYFDKGRGERLSRTYGS
jgi:hypothetical protein